MRTLDLPVLLAAATCLCAQEQGPVLDPQALIPGTNTYRCGTPAVGGLGAPTDHPDCDSSQTNPSATYAPTTLVRIPVVVHVIQNTSGTGNLSDALVHSQITVLNEDFRALPGTAGAPGTDTQIEFFLATQDPSGSPTTGITRHTNNTWFGDGGSYWTSIAWDTTRYLNIYTNSPGGGGVLGYVPNIPSDGGVLNTTADRVVVRYSAFGRPGTGGAPFHLGRTCTHEVGHYLGLFHTFHSGCGTSSCYTTGDRICDTNAEQNPRFGCQPSATSCGTLDPVRNYMDYSDDACFTHFTPEQARRMRCTLVHYRPNLAQPGGPQASATVRTGAGNLNNVYTSNPPVMGQTMVSQAVVSPGTWGLGAVFAYLDPATIPFNGYTILVDIGSPEIYATSFVPPQFGVLMAWGLQIPTDPVFNGLAFSTQCLLLDATSFGLTNAVDMVIGP
jgi:hypothetical protein